MSQSKLESFIEANTRSIVALLVAIPLNYFIVGPVWGLQMSGPDAIGVSVFFTIVSTCITYITRRWFNDLNLNKIIRSMYARPNNRL